VAQGNGDLAVERELKRVRNQIQDNLLPHVAIDKDRLRKRRAIDNQPQPCALRGRTKDAGQIRGERGKVSRLEHGLHAPRFETGEVQQPID
jgi:hypothetical protein